MVAHDPQGFERKMENTAKTWLALTHCVLLGAREAPKF